MCYKLHEHFPEDNQANQILFVEGKQSHGHTKTVIT